jgi:hypothetical protein
MGLISPNTDQYGFCDISIKSIEDKIKIRKGKQFLKIWFRNWSTFNRDQTGQRPPCTLEPITYSILKTLVASTRFYP